MASIRDNITSTIGKTPLVRLSRFSEDLVGNIVAKLEFQNPMRSVKDRAALAMIETAEMMGQIKKGTTVIEATSGNTGIALAFICSAKGYPLIVTMPDYASREKKMMLEALGAKVYLTPTEELMKGSIDKALSLKEEISNSYMPMQFENEANAKAHFESTGPEIWQDTDGEIDIFAAGVGTGGTITGVGQYLKARKSSVEIVAIEPENCAVISGEEANHHGIQGIGAGFVPKILDTELIDSIIKVKDEEAVAMCKKLALTEGILVGLSSGANLFAAQQLANKPGNEDKLIAIILCDTGERYLSTELFSK